MLLNPTWHLNVSKSDYISSWLACDFVCGKLQLLLNRNICFEPQSYYKDKNGPSRINFKTLSMMFATNKQLVRLYACSTKLTLTPLPLHAVREALAFTLHWLCSHMHHRPPLNSVWAIQSQEILKAVLVQLHLYYELFTSDQIIQFGWIVMLTEPQWRVIMSMNTTFILDKFPLGLNTRKCWNLISRKFSPKSTSY